MAWSDAARKAALEARRRRMKTAPQPNYGSREAYARILRGLRKRYPGSQGLDRRSKNLMLRAEAAEGMRQTYRRSDPFKIADARSLQRGVAVARSRHAARLRALRKKYSGSSSSIRVRNQSIRRMAAADYERSKRG